MEEKFIEENLVNEKIEVFNLEIFQDPRFFKFGVDAVCLARFASKFKKIKRPKYIDLCSGTGIVGLVYSRLNDLNYVEFLEKTEFATKINIKNALHNNVKHKIYTIDLEDASSNISNYSYDYITVNPPYMKNNSGLNTNSFLKDVAKIEQNENFLERIFEQSRLLLKDKGELYMVHKVERLADIFSSCRKQKMEAKTMQFIRNKGAKKSSLVLLRFVKNSNSYLEVMEDMEI